MMPLTLTVISSDKSVELAWKIEIENSLQSFPQISVEAKSLSHTHGQVILIDGKMDQLEEKLAQIDRQEKAVFLVLPESDSVPDVLSDRRVDGVLVHPFRSLEIFGKIQQYQQLILWGEISRLNQSFSGLIENLTEDLKLAERLQKSCLPSRFPDIKGFKVVSRYLAGLRAGGDHFDLAESKDGSQISVLFTDSSSYGLSSAILSVLMRVAARLSVEESRSCAETVKKITEEILMALNPKDQLSLFYGIVSKKNLSLRYTHLGSGGIFHVRQGQEVKILSPQGGPISHTAKSLLFSESVIGLEPGDRLVLISDGFIEAMGGTGETQIFLEKFKNKDPLDALNELTFKIKSKIVDPEELPAQDCTAVILEVDSRVVRLTRV